MNYDQCKLCLNEEAEFIANKVLKKDLSHERAAKELDVSLPEWVSHYELHIRNKLITAISHDMEPFKKGLLDKIEEGKQSVQRVIDLTKKINIILSNEDNQKNVKLISVYATLERNLIQSLKELAVLEGDITQASVINIQNNTIKVDKIMAIVMEEASPELKNKILKKLENIEVSNAN